MHLAVDGDEPRGADEGAGVEEAVAVALEQTENGPGAQLAAVGGDGVAGRAGQRLGMGTGLVLIAEAVAGQGALGEDDQPGAAANRLAQPSAQDGEVGSRVGEAA
jgi:hypothetical protein